MNPFSFQNKGGVRVTNSDGGDSSSEKLSYLEPLNPHQIGFPPPIRSA
jgi:hypothetical protein